MQVIAWSFKNSVQIVGLGSSHNREFYDSWKTKNSWREKENIGLYSKEKLQLPLLSKALEEKKQRFLHTATLLYCMLTWGFIGQEMGGQGVQLGGLGPPSLPISMRSNSTCPESSSQLLPMEESCGLWKKDGKRSRQSPMAKKKLMAFLRLLLKDS